jgi:hypothetical protein
MTARHRGNSVETAHIAALKDFDDACRTAVELYRRGRASRATGHSSGPAAVSPSPSVCPSRTTRSAT